MISWLRHLIGWFISVFRSREDLILENLALRQQLLALRARRPRRRVSALQKLFWIVLRRLWAGWKKPLILVTPRTVVGWHRAGFRLYWRLISRVHKPGGRKPVSKEIRALIFRMAAENPTWGAPRIHGELLKLGFDSPQPFECTSYGQVVLPYGSGRWVARFFIRTKLWRGTGHEKEPDFRLFPRRVSACGTVHPDL